MKLFAINTENWKSDGGAVFGVVPKTIWSKFCPSDEQNNINVSNRNLLVKTDDKLILFDTGMGNKQDEKFFRFRYRFGDQSLERAFKESGHRFEDVTDVVFTHLHYDHCGGAVYRKADDTFALTFPNAKHWVSKDQWEWALRPNAREGASYFPENYMPILDAGRLNFIEQPGVFCKGINFRLFYGHTAGQIIPIIEVGNKTLAFTADFIASAGHIPLPYIPSYDIMPLLSLKEKEEFLIEACENSWTFMFQHDYYNECCSLIKDHRGIRKDKSFTLSKFLGE